MLDRSEEGFRLLSNPMAITGKSPLWDEARGCVWWIDIQAQRLLATDETGETRALPVPSQPGFVVLADSGRLVLGLENGLWTYSPESGEWERHSDTESDRPTVRLNDGKPDRFGCLWFGSMDMTHQGLAIGRLYRRDPLGKIRAVREAITIPNAIVPCGNGNSLLFTDSPSGQLELIELDRDGGDILRSNVIYRAGSRITLDSGCLDAEGNVWVAAVGAGKVLQIAPSGRLLSQHLLPVSRITAAVIGGRDGQTLFVTCQRRFLDAEQLSREPGAGGLFCKPISIRSSPVYRVAGL